LRRYALRVLVQLSNNFRRVSESNHRDTIAITKKRKKKFRAFIAQIARVRFEHASRRVEYEHDINRRSLVGQLSLIRNSQFHRQSDSEQRNAACPRERT
jgi:hypothetical protein